MERGWVRSRHEFNYFKYGSHALLLEWPASQSFKTMERVLKWRNYIDALHLQQIDDITIGYHSLTVFLNSRSLSQERLIELLESMKVDDTNIRQEKKTHTIPVDYSIEKGEDLPIVAAHTGLTIEDIISIHTSPTYKIHFIGFLPGFLYLGGLSESLIIPRREQPRVNVPAGSVAIAAGQTGIYPMTSPGGWHIIGKTDTDLFDPSSNPPCPFAPGDELKFEAV